MRVHTLKVSKLMVTYLFASRRDVSSLYRYEPELGRFVLHSNLTTPEALSAEFFVIDNTQYLFLSIFRAANGAPNTHSQLYQWNRASDRFELRQLIPTNGARNAKFFEQGGRSFLAIANIYDGVSYAPDSYVLAWCGAQRMLACLSCAES
eukprot:m.755514 g.755514  ORF g.755514 m.755514 type:complete len:150 (-) comp59014_c0_seq23:760-1209(-)